VLTVSVGAPLPPVTVAGLTLHFGGTAVAGVMAQVRFTVELKLPAGAIVTVDMAEPPGVMLAGDSAVATSVNPDTVRLAVVLWARLPEVAVMVKLKLPELDVVVFTVRGVPISPLLPNGTRIEAGEQEAPEGNPEQVTATVPENPACGFT
jgi:hypothetical protein